VMRHLLFIGSISLATALMVGPASAQHGGMGMPAVGGPVVVKVLKVDRSGSVTPLPGAEVVLERWMGDPMRAPKLENRAAGMVGIRLAGAKVGTTDSQGQAQFEPPQMAPGQLLSVSVLHDGHTFGGEQFKPSAKPVEIRVYERTEDTSELSCDLFVGMFVDERMVVTDITMTFNNNQPVIVDTDRTGLRLPMVLPAVRGEPVEGVLPDGALRNIANQRQPVRGRIRMEKGTVVYRGPIMPGSSQQIRLRYGIPIERSVQDIAIKSVLKADRVRVLARWSRRIAPRLVPTRSFTAFERDEGEFRQRQIVIDGELPANTPMLMHLDRLPHATSAEGTVALIGSLVLLALFGLALVAPPEALERFRRRS